MNSQEEKERAFWNRFADYLRGFGVSEVSIRNQTAFAKSFVVGLDCRLGQCDESMVNAFFTGLGRDPSRSFVATSQAVDAVKFLLKLAKIRWAESVDWEGHKSSFRPLPPSHPTRLRRDTLEERRERSDPTNWNLASSDHELLQACQDALRSQNKAIRTEQSYLGSVKHFLKFVRQIKGEDYATRDIPPEDANALAGMFLSHLATERGVCANTQSTKLNGIVYFYRNVLGIAPHQRDRHPVDPGNDGAYQARNHHDLHPCHRTGRCHREQPARFPGYAVETGPG